MQKIIVYDWIVEELRSKNLDVELLLIFWNEHHDNNGNEVQ